MAERNDDSGNISVHIAAPTLVLNSGESIPISSDSSGLGASEMNSSEHTSLFSVSSAEQSLEIEYDFDAFIQQKAKQPQGQRHGAHLLRPHPKSRRSQPSDSAASPSPGPCSCLPRCAC